MGTDPGTDPGSRRFDLSTLEDHLEDLAVRAASHLGPDVDCSIIVRHLGVDRRVASSAPRAARCDDAETAAGDGPCLTAMSDLHSVVIPDVLAEQSWPVWRREVLVVGYRSAAAFPAHVPPGTDIAFNLYSDAFDPWTRDVVLHADLYAQEVGRVAALCLDLDRLTRAHAALATAVEDRRTVDLAVGVTMALRGSTPGEARDQLRAAAQVRGVDVLTQARDVVDGRSRPGGGAGPGPATGTDLRTGA